MKNLFFTAACFVALITNGIAQPFPINTNNSFNGQETVDIKTYRDFVYVLASFNTSTTFNSGLTISPVNFDKAIM